jgi:polar amino acid transport system substrate-binding protein
VGTSADFPPFESVDMKTKDIVGFDIDIAKEVAAKANKKLEILDISFDGLISAIKAGSVDFVIAGMTITPARAQQVDFSDPYFGGNQAVVIKASRTDITKWGDLNCSIRIGVQTDTTGDIWASNVSNIKNNGPEIVRYPKFTTAMLELDKGGIDAVIIDSAPAKSYTTSHQSLKVSFEIPTKEKFGVAVKKGDSSNLKLVNDTLSDLRSSGRYDELYKKWFS